MKAIESCCGKARLPPTWQLHSTFTLPIQSLRAIFFLCTFRSHFCRCVDVSLWEGSWILVRWPLVLLERHANFDPTETSTTFIITFIALQLLGALLFSLILLSAWLSRGAQRHRIFFSFCFAWTVYAISYSLLILAGQHFRKPDRILCTIQASLIYAVPFLCVVYLIAYDLHLSFGPIQV
jgi:hypothetical protein